MLQRWRLLDKELMGIRGGRDPLRLSILSKNRYRTTNELHFCAISLTDDVIAGAESISKERPS